MRQIALALALIFGLANGAAAQAPPPVPTLPDSARLTSYSISTSTCACSVGFQIYGSGTDVDEWIQVYVNGVAKTSTDPTFGWSLSSVSPGGLTGPRPITNAVLTFNAAQTATVVIVGDERPRRLSQFPENRGVAARDLNQAVTDIIAVQRELWDKANRSIVGQPGDSLLPLPSVAARAGQYLCFDSNGNPIPCQSASPGSVTLPGSSVNGDSVCFSGTTGKSFSDCGWGITGTAAAGSIPLGRSGAVAAWTQAPCSQIEAFGGVGDGVTDNSPALTAALATASCVLFSSGHYMFLSQVTKTVPAASSICLVGAGQDVARLDFKGTSGPRFTVNDLTSSVCVRDLTIETFDATNTGISLTQGTAVSSGAAQAQSVFQNVTFRGDDGNVQSTKSWLIAVNIAGLSNVNFVNVSIFGAAPISGGYTLVGKGVALGPNGSIAGVQYNFVSCNFAYLGIGIDYGDLTQGVSVSASNFTGGNRGILVESTATGISELLVVGSQFNTKAVGIDTAVPVPGTSIIGNYFFPQNGGVGLNLEIAAYYTIASNIFQGPGSSPTAICLVVQSTSGNLSGVISANVVAGCATGIWLQANTAFVKLRGNSYTENTANVLNQSVSGSDTLGNANDLGDDYFTTYRALTACNSPSAGLTATLTDSTTNTWGANITTGAGSDIVRAVCNGTNWTVMGK